MNERRLGLSGNRVSELGLGCNSFGVRTDFDGARRVIHAALDAGVTLFDTADVYGHRYGNPSASERYLGHQIRQSQDAVRGRSA
jgi:aryl-alcohol dehydrogenase-like predicted oxidoreductase